MRRWVWGLFCCLYTVGQNNQEYRLKYWATRSSVRSFARTAHSFACSLTTLTPSLMGKWIIGWLFCLCFFFDHSAVVFFKCYFLVSRSRSSYFEMLTWHKIVFFSVYLHRRKMEAWKYEENKRFFFFISTLEGFAGVGFALLGSFALSQTVLLTKCSHSQSKLWTF